MTFDKEVDNILVLLVGRIGEHNGFIVGDFDIEQRELAKAKLQTLLNEARIDTLNQIRHSDVKLNHGTIELMGYMSQQLNKEKNRIQSLKGNNE